MNVYESIMQGLNEAVDYCEGERAGDTLEAAKENAKDAKGEWIKAALDSGMNIPEPKH